LREEFEAAVATTLLKKSPRQLKRWRDVRDRAITVFKSVLKTDKSITELTRDDVLAFRGHLQDRVRKGEIEIDTANKNLGRVATMFRAVDEAKMLRLPPIFDKIMLRGGKDRQRIPYQASFVQSHFLADGTFDGINEEERRIIFLIMETGIRPAEACNLNRATIVLDHSVPHIKVRPDGRELKTEHSMRDIPLVGVALMAMRLQPDGFPRYRERSDELSAAVNKTLTARKLRPNGESLYSLRHCFKDRLRQARVEDELKDYLMGHKTDQPEYGFGYSLEVKADVLKGIAFRPPRSV
jgi:integrase